MKVSFILPYINANIINKGAATGDIDYIFKNGLYMALIALFMMVTGILGANFAIRGASRFAAGIRMDVFIQIHGIGAGKDYRTRYPRRTACGRGQIRGPLSRDCRVGVG